MVMQVRDTAKKLYFDYLWGCVVPRRSDGSQYRHQLAATTKAILRISFTWTLVNAQFWSTQ